MTDEQHPAAEQADKLAEGGPDDATLAGRSGVAEGEDPPNSEPGELREEDVTAEDGLNDREQ